jgi:ketosteroid isomerase-like protein
MAAPDVQATIELLRGGIEAFNRRDIDGALAPLDPEVELVPLKAVLDGGSYHGHEGMRRLLDDMREDWERFSLEVDEFRPVGTDRLLVLGRVIARGRTSGVDVDYEAAWLCHLHAGRVIRMQFYSDRNEAIAAAGG